MRKNRKDSKPWEIPVSQPVDNDGIRRVDFSSELLTDAFPDGSTVISTSEPSVDGDRPDFDVKSGGKKAPVFAWILCGFLVMIGVVAVFFLREVIYQDGFPVAFDDNRDAWIVARTLERTKPDAPADPYVTALQSGHISLEYFLRVQFTNREYLISEPDQATFVSDLCYALDIKDPEVLIQQLNPDDGLVNRLEDLPEDYSRFSILSAGLRAVGDEAVFGDFPSGLSDLIIGETLTDAEGYSLGIRRSSGSFTGSADLVRLAFYHDNVRESIPVKIETVEEKTSFLMAWDAGSENPGEHDVTVLLRCANGRAYVLSDGIAKIPEVNTLQNYEVLRDSLPSGETEKWYVLDAQESNAYLNFLEVESDIAVTLYDRMGIRIGENDMPGEEVLRGKAQMDAEDTDLHRFFGKGNLFYARVSRSPNAVSPETDASYRLVTSKEVAANKAGGMYAVRSVVTPAPEEKTNKLAIYCTDESGEDRVLSQDDVRLLPINGHLRYMNFVDGQSRDSLKIAPGFDAKTLDYGYVFPQEKKETELFVASKEGYAARVEVFVTDADGQERRYLPEGDRVAVDLAPSRNTIRVVVTDFDGEETVYSLFVLSGKDHLGYDGETLARFPESYHNGLWLLHNVQPSYVFEPYVTDLAWSDVMAAQDNKDKSLTHASSYPQWIKEGSPVYDGKAWYAARGDVVAYFVDPRNFLDPVQIFQFEKLKFDASVHSAKGVEALLRDTFMGSSEDAYDEWLMEAGVQAEISPYFITSRILQEMGRDGVSMLAHGTLPDYEGVFNYYNIGSTPNPEVENGALINGARYALWGTEPDKREITPSEARYLLPWDSKEKAIIGGAKWIAARYIHVGQDTLYFQKFDVIANEDGLYNHQYAQNITMPYTECLRYYEAYISEDILSFPFVFSIPIYNDMPQDFGVWPE